MRKSALEPSERDLRNEARALQMGGDPASAKRFIAVANAMSRPEKIRQDVMESHANPLLGEILGERIEGPDEEAEDLSAVVVVILAHKTKFKICLVS
jgi:hypothetical protein